MKASYVVLDGSDIETIFGMTNIACALASWRRGGCTCRPLGLRISDEDENYIVLGAVHDERCPSLGKAPSRHLAPVQDP